jgi:hypothetical protein
VRGSATGKQQLLAVLLQLRKHRGGGGFCILYLPYWQSGTPDTFAQKRCVFEEGRGAQGDTAGIETGEAVRGSTTGKQQLLAVLLLLRKHREGGGSGGPARLLRASRHDFGCLEVSGGPTRLLRASRHDFGRLEVSGGPARLLRASRHDLGRLEVSGGPARLLRASRHDLGCLEVSTGIGRARVSTTGKQQRGCEHYWDRTGADIHYWQAAELAIVGRKLLGEKDSEERDGGFGGCIRLLALLAC